MRAGPAFSQQSRAGDVHADQHQRDVHAHQRPDQVQGVPVGLAVHPQPGDVVQYEHFRAVVVQGLADRPDQLRQRPGIVNWRAVAA
jgi:hypothetical protein